jgi:antitoxin CcdA
MKVISAARKRPVNLTLNEELVRQARMLTNNLSGVVEKSLAEFVATEQRERLARAQAAKHTAALWNDFDQSKGSFADEYSTL